MSRRLLLITEEEWLKSAHDAKYCVQGMARSFNVPERTLRRHLHNMTGHSPQDWLREVRMARAQHWLAEGMKVVWVAREMCYKSEASFSREFKKRFGYPPGEHARRRLVGKIS